MPELAEVEYFRKQWNPGLGKKTLRADLHGHVRIFRGINIPAMEKSLASARLRSSSASGKQMIFRFDRCTLGIHLGMTGELRAEPPDYIPGKHDHLVLRQKVHSLVFSDPRLFGRVLWHEGPGNPPWWIDRAPDLLSDEFTKDELAAFLARRKGAPIKALLLMQERFPGVGNWMADEILWRARIHPATLGGKVPKANIPALWKATREVCREALRIIGKDWGDPPDSWLFNHRWKKGGHCPRCGGDLSHREIGGRTTCWCPACQKKR